MLRKVDTNLPLLRYLRDGSHRYIVSLLLCLGIIGGIAAFSSTADAESTTSQSGRHVLTVYDGSKEQGVLTEAKTVGDALKAANIELAPNDVTEPALTEELVAASYDITIYRARPVLIIDGANRVKVMTPYRTAKQIAAQANLQLHDQDIVRLESAEDVVSDGALERMVVSRATKFMLVFYGKKSDAYTRATTVGEMLKEKDIIIAENERISVPLETPLQSGMTVELWREGKQTITQEEAVEFPVEKIQDANRDVGYREVKTPGKNGKQMVTYEVVIKNGEEVSRKAVAKVVTEEPTKQVEVVGAKVQTFGGDCASWMAAAGITDLANASYLIKAESGCNPYAVNRSSGACGVGQALPCGKTGCAMGDGACQTAWMNSYVLGRYGSWQAAADHHRAYGWY